MAKKEIVSVDVKNIIFTNSEKKGEDGFSLIEAIIAITILTFGLLSVVTIFAYSVRTNTGNSQRAQALAVLQREVEILRSAKFTPQTTDAALQGGTRTNPPVTTPDGTTYQIEVTVDNDPFLANVQDETPPHNTKKLKEITLTITPQRASENWVTAMPTRVVLRRVRGN